MDYDPKEALRKRLLGLLRNQKEESRFQKSALIYSKLFARQEFKDAKIIMFYVSFDGEVDTREMIKEAMEQGKKVVLPITITEEKKIIPSLIEDLENDLTDGPYGIQQPKTNPAQALNFDELDVVIVPGVAFDKKANRMGRGQGYYDRFLKKLPSHVATIGLAFDFQVVEDLPFLKDHDIPVSFVITN